MTRLVHLNGPPGIGKSTLGHRYVDDHALSLCLDIDSLRRHIGRWDEHPEASGLLARQAAVEIARTHLRNGHDVVVAQYVARPEFVLELADVAAATGASFVEIVLLDSRADSAERFEARREDPRLTEHHEEAVRMLAGDGGFLAMYDRLVATLPHLPAHTVITTAAGDVDGAYSAVLATLEADSQQS